MLLPFALLVASERSGIRTLAARAASSLFLGGLAARLTAAHALRAALLAALCAAVCGLAGGLVDSLRTLAASTLISTLSYAALPLAQAVVVAGSPSAAHAARRIGALCAVDALASSAGVQASLASLGTARWANGGPAAVLLCAAAAAAAVAGSMALQLLRPESDREWVTDGERTREEATVGTRGLVLTAGRLCWSVLALAVAVTLPSVALQHGVEKLPRAPSALDRLLDAGLRFATQVLIAPLLIERGGTHSGPRAATLTGCVIVIAAGVASTCAAAIAPAAALDGATGSTSALLHGASMQLQRAAHHVMTSGVYLTETAATTLVALSAASYAPPAMVPAFCALSLVLLHTGVTLGPALLPLAGWLVGGDAIGHWTQLLLPAVLVALVPSPMPSGTR